MLTPSRTSQSFEESNCPSHFVLWSFLQCPDTFQNNLNKLPGHSNVKLPTAALFFMQRPDTFQNNQIITPGHSSAKLLAAVSALLCNVLTPSRTVNMLTGHSNVIVHSRHLQNNQHISNYSSVKLHNAISGLVTRKSRSFSLTVTSKCRDKSHKTSIARNTPHIHREHTFLKVGRVGGIPE